MGHDFNIPTYNLKHKCIISTYIRTYNLEFIRKTFKWLSGSFSIYITQLLVHIVDINIYICFMVDGKMHIAHS